jgi:hypothetical protein
VRHEAFIVDRGGQEAKIVEQLDGLRLVRWHRERDNVSEAEVVVQSKNPKCQALLHQRGLAMRYEIVIKRDGVRVWEGPITRRHLEGSAVVRLHMRDVLLFAQRTRCTKKWSSAFAAGGPDYVTERTLKIIKDEMAKWEGIGDLSANFIPNIVVRENTNTAKTTRISEKNSQYVWDDMEALAAKSGMDYTVANRSLYLFDTHQFLGMGRQLTDEDFLGDLEIVEYGLELASLSSVTDGMGHVAVQPVADAYYGPFELLASAYTSQTTSDRIPQSELAAQATRNARSRYPAPMVLRVPENTMLRPDVVDDLMPYLIPGTGFPVYSTSTGLELKQTQKLDRVVVEETEQGESVGITLSPAPIGSGLEEDV